MSYIIFLFIYFLQITHCTCNGLSFNDLNCSLSFTVQTLTSADVIETNLPIGLTGNYNLSCNISDFKAYYKITPLEILVFQKSNYNNENIQTMIELNSTTFHFDINQSSTARLCVFLNGQDDNDHRLCRQIHIGISNLCNFWTFPMIFIYLFSLSSLTCYYAIHCIRNRWGKSGKRTRSSKPTPAQRMSMSETKHDTLENEKVADEESSGGEEQEED